MKQIKELSVWDLPDTKNEPDGYNLKTVPDMSARNIGVLVEKINEVIQVINKLSSEVKE